MSKDDYIYCRNQVCRFIKQKKTISVEELCELTHLDALTISQIIKNLVGSGKELYEYEILYKDNQVYGVCPFVEKQLTSQHEITVGKNKKHGFAVLGVVVILAFILYSAFFWNAAIETANMLTDMAELYDTLNSISNTPYNYNWTPQILTYFSVATLFISCMSICFYLNHKRNAEAIVVTEKFNQPEP